MKLKKKVLFSATVFLATSISSWAVVLPSGVAGYRPSSVATSGVVSRGGTITSVAMKDGTITVDGTAYLFSKYSATIHDENPPTKFHVGMQIRFNTVKDFGGERIIEIWPMRKKSGGRR